MRGWAGWACRYLEVVTRRRLAVGKTVCKLSAACGYRCGYSRWKSTLKGGPAADIVIERRPLLGVICYVASPAAVWRVQSCAVGFRISGMRDSWPRMPL